MPPELSRTLNSHQIAWTFAAGVIVTLLGFALYHVTLRFSSDALPNSAHATNEQGTVTLERLAEIRERNAISDYYFNSILDSITSELWTLDDNPSFTVRLPKGFGTAGCDDTFSKSSKILIGNADVSCAVPSDADIQIFGPIGARYEDAPWAHALASRAQAVTAAAIGGLSGVRFFNAPVGNEFFLYDANIIGDFAYIDGAFLRRGDDYFLITFNPRASADGIFVLEKIVSTIEFKDAAPR